MLHAARMHARVHRQRSAWGLLAGVQCTGPPASAAPTSAVAESLRTFWPAAAWRAMAAAAAAAAARLGRGASCSTSSAQHANLTNPSALTQSVQGVLRLWLFAHRHSARTLNLPSSVMSTNSGGCGRGEPGWNGRSTLSPYSCQALSFIRCSWRAKAWSCWQRAWSH